jgi:hypothetical protein
MASVSTAGKTLYFFDGTVWIPVGGGGAPTGASVIYSDSQPDVTNLEVGTIWVDSDAVITGGGSGGGTVIGGPSFQTIVTSPVSASIVAQTSGEILTLISGENISIVNASANNSVTISSTGNYSSVDSITYPDYIVFDTTPENTSASVGTISWDSGESGLATQLNTNINVILGQEIYSVVYNGEGTTLNKGEVVMVSGAQGQKPRVIRAYNTSDAGSARTFGIVAENIASGAEGIVITQGIVKNINTNGFNEGDPLYLSATPGQLTTTKPQAPNHYVWVGVVVKKNSSSGRIYVKPQNGYELDEIHDVRITNVQNDDLILWNSASSIWVNSPKQNIINTASAAAVSYLVDGAPEALNTLNELSEALNDNADILDTLLTTTAASSTYLPLSASASFYRWTKTYSASASVISGVDDNSISLSYNEGYIQLFINGVMLDPSEYTATDGSTITVNAPVLSGEVVDIFAFLNSTSVNTYSQAQIDNKYNNLTRWKKAYSASATVISGVDDNSNTLSYLSGYEQFYLNGILLTPITDYARTDSSIVTLSTPLISGDIVEIINTQPFNVADVYNTSQSDNRYLTQSSASTTYLTQSSASSTYLTQSSASSTYLTQSSASTAYRTIGSTGLAKIVPSSIAVGSGTSSANAFGTVTFSGVSSISLNGVFSETYTSYKIVLTNVKSSQYTEIQARLRVSGSNNTSSNYNSLQTYTAINNAGAGHDKFPATTYWIFANVTANGQIDSWYDIWNPYATTLTQYSFTHAKRYDTGDHYNMVGGGVFNATTSFDGLSIIASAGTITGTLSVYGYN